MKIAVYLGSTPGNDPIFEKTAASVGRWIGENGHTLVYGGAGVGTMKTGSFKSGVGRHLKRAE